MAALRVLHIMSSTMRAGVAAMVMNLYRHIDREKLQFDFVVHDLGEDDFGDEIRRLGGRVFRVPFLSQAGMSGFVRIIGDIIEKNGPYAAVHAHTDYQGGFCVKAAKKAGVPIRICHAHSDTRCILSPLLTAKKLLGRGVIARHATQRCACSRNAGLAVYGRRAVAEGRVRIIKDGIDLAGFWDCPPQTREKLLGDCYADDDTWLIGYVGRLSPEKNPSFILDMAAEAQKKGANSRFIYVGTGIMRDELIRKRRILSLNNVFFLGVRADVPALMQCFHLVVVPSFAEGFSLVAAEAQAAGTPVLATAGIPEETDMGLGLLHRMRLCEGASRWMERAGTLIVNARRPDAATRIGKARARGFDVQSHVTAMIGLYGFNGE